MSENSHQKRVFGQIVSALYTKDAASQNQTAAQRRGCGLELGYCSTVYAVEPAIVLRNNN